MLACAWSTCHTNKKISPQQDIHVYITKECRESYYLGSDTTKVNVKNDKDWVWVLVCLPLLLANKPLEKPDPEQTEERGLTSLSSRSPPANREIALNESLELFRCVNVCNWRRRWRRSNTNQQHTHSSARPWVSLLFREQWQLLSPSDVPRPRDRDEDETHLAILWEIYEGLYCIRRVWEVFSLALHHDSQLYTDT